MAKKYISGIMAAFIVLLSLFGSGGQAYASSPVGGSSLSKWVYAETDELEYQAPVMAGMSEANIWKAIDQGIEMGLANSKLDVYHIFQRVSIYGLSSELLRAFDAHDFVTVEKAFGAKPVRFQGKLYFENASGGTVPYSSLRIYNTTATPSGPAGIDWDKFNYPAGLGMPSLTTNGKFVVTVIDKITAPYDPKNPPPYALPGYNQPTQPSNPPPGGGGGGGGITAPTRPEPPDDSWDIIGWFKYLIAWIVYVWDTFVWLLAELGTKVGELMTAGDGMVSFLSSFFGWLPPEITTLIGIGIICAIILVVFKR